MVVEAYFRKADQGFGHETVARDQRSRKRRERDRTCGGAGGGGDDHVLQLRASLAGQRWPWRIPYHSPKSLSHLARHRILIMTSL